MPRCAHCGRSNSRSIEKNSATGAPKDRNCGRTGPAGPAGPRGGSRPPNRAPRRWRSAGAPVRLRQRRGIDGEFKPIAGRRRRRGWSAPPPSARRAARRSETSDEPGLEVAARRRPRGELEHLLDQSRARPDGAGRRAPNGATRIGFVTELPLPDTRLLCAAMRLLDKMLPRLINRGELTIIDPDGRDPPLRRSGPGAETGHRPAGGPQGRASRSPAIRRSARSRPGWTTGCVLEQGEIIDLILLIRRNRRWEERTRPNEFLKKTGKLRHRLSTLNWKSRVAEERRPPLRHRQRALPALPRSGHAI